MLIARYTCKAQHMQSVEQGCENVAEVLRATASHAELLRACQNYLEQPPSPPKIPRATQKIPRAPSEPPKIPGATQKIPRAPSEPPKIPGAPSEVARATQKIPRVPSEHLLTNQFSDASKTQLNVYAHTAQEQIQPAHT